MDTPIHSFEPTKGVPIAAATAPAGGYAIGAQLPPSGNTGGKLWTVTDPDTGEVFLQLPSDTTAPSLVHLSAADSHPYAAITDFLNCTFKFSSFDPLEALFNILFSSREKIRPGDRSAARFAWLSKILPAR